MSHIDQYPALYHYRSNSPVSETTTAQWPLCPAAVRSSDSIGSSSTPGRRSNSGSTETRFPPSLLTNLADVSLNLRYPLGQPPKHCFRKEVTPGGIVHRLNTVINRTCTWTAPDGDHWLPAVPFTDKGRLTASLAHSQRSCIPVKSLAGMFDPSLIEQGLKYAHATEGRDWHLDDYAIRLSDQSPCGLTVTAESREAPRYSAQVHFCDRGTQFDPRSCYVSNDRNDEDYWRNALSDDQ